MSKTSMVLSIVAVTAVVLLFAVSLITVSQHASATVLVHHKVTVHHKAPASVHASTRVTVHHKAHTASKGKISVHQVAVIPEAHNNPDKVLQNTTAMKALVKGPDGENIVIGGMMSDGY